MFIPTTKSELTKLGWSGCDVILISGDAYIDSPFDGVAIIGKYLIKNGFRVGIISQPDIASPSDIMRLGSPQLFWGVSSGCVDSMVANYTATKKRRQKDDLTPGGENNRRPDRAVLKYVNVIKQHDTDKKPVVLGGIEASLRRIAHYDFWDNSVRRSILFDSKADFLLYGMAEKSVAELALALQNNEPADNIRGLSYIAREPKESYIELPAFELVRSDKNAFMEMFDIFYKNTDALNAKGLYQKTGERYLIQNPPQPAPRPEELDEYYEMDFEYDAHPSIKKQGKVIALDTIKQSVTSHRGCFGECNFCAIALHQGRRIVSRSEDSIVREVKKLAEKPKFNGIIYDVGGPSANMYGMTCKKQSTTGSCQNKRCLSPNICKSMDINHSRYTKLLQRLMKIDSIRKIFVSSGLRYDLIMERNSQGDEFMQQLVRNHVSGQLKIAPEHVSPRTLEAMGKSTDKNYLPDFKRRFDDLSKKFNKNQFLTYYFMAAHPDCNNSDMELLGRYAKEELKSSPEQLQVFTPTPSTYSTLMYYTGFSPITNKEVFVEKDTLKKQKQKDLILGENKFRRKK